LKKRNKINFLQKEWQIFFRKSVAKNENGHLFCPFFKYGKTFPEKGSRHCIIVFYRLVTKKIIFTLLPYIFFIFAEKYLSIFSVVNICQHLATFLEQKRAKRATKNIFVKIVTINAVKSSIGTDIF